MHTFYFLMAAIYRRGHTGAYLFLHDRCIECGERYHLCECYD